MDVIDGLGGQIGGSCSEAGDHGGGDFAGLVSGVVEELDLEAVARIVEAATGIKQAVDDELFVEDGKLHGDEGKLAFRILSGWFSRFGGVALVAEIEPDELVTMDSVEGKDDHHDEVRDQQGDVKGVPAIDVAEGVVGVMRLPIVAEPALRA
jgi:hypothetical protein